MAAKTATNKSDTQETPPVTPKRKAPRYKKIVKQQLLDLLVAISDEQDISLVVMTMPTIPKSYPIHGRVTKLSLITGKINVDITKHINDRLEAAKLPADYQPGKRAWGTRLNNCSIIEHKDKHYVSVLITDAKSTFLVDGKKASFRQEEEIKGLVRSGGGHPVRDYGLDSIIEITILGRTFKVRPGE